MDSTTLSTDPSSKQLDLLLAHVAKELDSVLPIPDHLINDFRRFQDENPLLGDNKGVAPPSAALVREPTDSTGAHDGVQKLATEQAFYDRAFRACAKRVVGLQEWQACVEENLTRSEHSRQVLQYVLDIINSMRDVTKLIQNQSNFLSHNASVLLTGCAKLKRVQAELQENLRHFSHMDDLNFETKGSTLSASSARFFSLFQDLEQEVQFLYEHRSFKSAPAYAAKLTEAQQRILNHLKIALENSFSDALHCTLESKAYKELVTSISLPSDNAVPPPLLSNATSKALDTSAEAAGGADSMENHDVAKTLMKQESMPSMLPDFELSVLSNSKGMTSPQGIMNTLENGLRAVNQLYLNKLNEHALLRRMIEMQKGFSYTENQTFEKDAQQRIEENAQLLEIFGAYQESRVGLVSPLLQQCLRHCCHADTVGTSTLLEETLQLLSSSEAQPENVASPSPAVPQSAGKFNSSLIDGRHALAQNVSTYSLPRLVSYIHMLLKVVLSIEHGVLESLWMRDDFVAWLLPKIISEMADGLYRQFRSRLLRVNDIKELCYTVEHVQTVLTRQNIENPQLSELSELWVVMVQDTQERIIFRTSDCLRQNFMCAPPTKELAKRYALADEETNIMAGLTEPPPESAGKKEGIFYAPGMLQAIDLLNLLYPAIEFSVFSVFAEETIDMCLKLAQEVGKLVQDYCVSAPAEESLPKLGDWGEVKGLLCQLAHLLYLRQELTHIDAKIAVVDKSLDFTKLAMKRKLEITESARESKTKVEAEVHTCAIHVSQALHKTIARPLTSATRMTSAAREKALKDMNQIATRAERVLSWFVSQDFVVYERLLQNLREGVGELVKEVAELPPSSAP